VPEGRGLERLRRSAIRVARVGTLALIAPLLPVAVGGPTGRARAQRSEGPAVPATAPGDQGGRGEVDAVPEVDGGEHGDDGGGDPDLADDEEGFGATATATAPRPERPVAGPAAATETVPGETLRRSADATLVETLSTQVPYLHATSRGSGIHGIGNGAAGSLSLRGLSGSPNTQVLVVLDGVPDQQGLFGHPLPDTYLPTLVQRATVVSGASSVRYGGNALGGALVLESRWLPPPSEPPPPPSSGSSTSPGRSDDGSGVPDAEPVASELNLDARYGSFGTATVDAAYLRTQGDVSLAVGASGTTTQGHRPGAGGTIAGGQVGLRLRLARRTALVLRYRLAYLDGTDPGPVSFPTPGRWFNSQRHAFSAGVEHAAGRWSTEATAFATVGRNRLYDGFEGQDVVAGVRTAARVGLPGGWSLRFGAAVDLVAGRVWDRLPESGGTGVGADGAPGTDGSRPEPLPEVEPQTTLALFQELRWSPTGWLDLELGARQAQSLVWGFLPVFEAGASVSPWEGGRLAFRWAQGFREPTLRERYLPFPTANQELRPERSRTVEVTVEQRWAKDRLRARVTAYRTRAEDLILTLGYFPTAEIRNVAQAEVRGIEALVDLRPWPWLHLRAGGGFIDPGTLTQQNPGRRVSGMLRVVLPEAAASLTATHLGALYGRSHRRDPLGDFVVLDGRLDVPIPGTPAQVYGVVRNLGDARYAFIPGYPMPPRHGLVGLRLTL